jgi:shikimate dehydrogenase
VGLSPGRLAVVGWPVDHSRSPAMQSAALAATGLDAEYVYERIAIAPEDFDETIASLPGQGFLGVNVTIPHKEAALAVATDASDEARAIGAANTLTFGSGGAIRADNTDAPAILDALGAPLPRTAVVLGAGGSARAVAFALHGAGVSVAVWNRSPERADRLAADLGVAAVDAVGPAKVLVNCTSAGLTHPADTFKELPLSSDDLGQYACVVDLVYRDGGTELLRQAERRGCRCIDGLEVLVRQGARSFEIWTGRRPPLEVMRRAAARSERPLPKLREQQIDRPPRREVP